MVKIQLVWHKLDEVGVGSSALYSIEEVEEHRTKDIVAADKAKK